MKLTKAECLARAALYEEAAEHIGLIWNADDIAATKSAFKFVEKCLRKEIDRWETVASERY